MQLDTSVTELKGVGAGLADKLSRIGVSYVRDLLFHLPIRYIDRTHLTPICDLKISEYALIQGEIIKANTRYGRRPALVFEVADSTGSLYLYFFHYFSRLKKVLEVGTVFRCYGQIRQINHRLAIIHPEYQSINQQEAVPLEEYLTSVYPSTEGLQQKRLQKLMDQVLTGLGNNPNNLEYLPTSLRDQFSLPAIDEALNTIHRPPPDVSLNLLLERHHPAQHRLIFEELLAHYLSLRILREKIRRQRAPVLIADIKIKDSFLQALPFSLTSAQKKACTEICADLGSGCAMLRLLQGDVGSGKTIVAAIAALQALASGYQVALMVPTELLAEQHFNTFSVWLEKFSFPVLRLYGRFNQAQKTDCLKQLSQSKPLLIIGTHALFQQEISFSKLGFVIIDEQHRFGVHQRLMLLEKAVDSRYSVHQLIMTATPIPRTLAMTSYADLDITIIDALPPNRQAVKTSVIRSQRRADIIDRIKHICVDGHQAYWVCTLVEESEALQCQAATDTYQHLQKVLPELKIGLVHGRMKGEEKACSMQAFKSGDIDLLVATTVIEVGVDVPNANLMIIEDADRLGLSQLHQLRGRIGRGGGTNYCILMYHPPISELGKKRLDIIRCTNNGFNIAEADLKLRGAGELLGTSQTGLPAMRIANIAHDADLLPKIQQAGQIILKEYPKIAPLLIHRWIGEKVNFGNV